MKKLIALLLAGVLCFTLCACGGDDGTLKEKTLIENEINNILKECEVLQSKMDSLYLGKNEENDYTKFNYYQLLRLWYKDNCVKITLPRINHEEKNVNNGEFVIAPEDVFNLVNRELTGWRYKGILYKPGEKMPIE